MNMGLERMLGDAQVVAVVCNQFGDTGKGAVTDLLAAYWADVVARGTGGNNAGHTTVVNGVKRVFHLIPSGIVNDARQVNILGSGMVLDLEVLGSELDELEIEGQSYNNLMISENAHVIMPYHIMRDKAKNMSLKNGGIGSTGRGIGECYADRTARRGITVKDLFNRDKLAAGIDKALGFYPELNLNRDDVIDELGPYAERIQQFVRDTDSELRGFKEQDKKILLEGAQGLLLSLDYGIPPYVTSSDCSSDGTAKGVGFSSRDVDLTLGIVKFPFMTKVGGGPFPSELGGIRSDDYCFDGEMNGDEEDVDCGGSCKSCVVYIYEEKRWWDFLFDFF